MAELSQLQASGSVVIAADAGALYDMVSDVTRMGEWSPACTSCVWDDGATIEPGSWFTGQNQLGDFKYETRCEVVAAERGKEFAWMVGGVTEGPALWRYRFTPVDGGTQVEESSALVRLTSVFAEMPDERLFEVVARNQAGIETTLANLKAAAEGS
jgi:hypothetical protein